MRVVVVEVVLVLSWERWVMTCGLRQVVGEEAQVELVQGFSLVLRVVAA